MQPSVQELLLSTPTTCCVIVGITAIILYAGQSSQGPNLNAFPTAGTSGWLGTLWDTIRCMTSAAELIQQGYKKFNGAPFKIPTPYHWAIVLSKRAHVEELRNARDDEFSLLAALSDDLNLKFTFQSDSVEDPYYLKVMRPLLARLFTRDTYPEIRDEIVTSFDEVLDLDDKEWKSLPALSTIQQIMSRVSNSIFRAFVEGRNPDFIALNIQNAKDIVVGAVVIAILPSFLKARAAWFMTKVHKNARRCIGHLRPIVEERRECLREYGKGWDEKPNDLLAYLIDEVPGATVESLTQSLQMVNFAAIHPSSNVFVCALYNLAANPQYIQPLREEVEAIVMKEGWSKASLSKMRKVDSFLRESTRMEGIGSLGMMRKAMKDFKFSDGTFVPKGARIGVGIVALHHDDALYRDPYTFEPFRFVDMDEDDASGPKHQFVSTSPEYLPFGHGRVACPGRFLAGLMLKTMLAHIVMMYDIKLVDSVARPQSLHITTLIQPSTTAKLAFKRRDREDGEQ